MHLNPDTIKAWRERQGISKEDLAGVLAVNKFTVDRWEEWASPDKPKTMPNGTAAAILQDLLASEDPIVRAHQIERAKQVANLIGEEDDSIEALMRNFSKYDNFGVGGYVMCQILKKIWEEPPK